MFYFLWMFCILLLLMMYLSLLSFNFISDVVVAVLMYLLLFTDLSCELFPILFFGRVWVPRQSEEF